MKPKPRLLHVTTVDMSLELLLGPQLRAFSDAGYEVIGASAPGPWTAALEADGITCLPLKHATRSMSPGRDLLFLAELRRLFRRLRPDIVHTHNPKPGIYGRLAAGVTRVPVVVNTVHGLYATPSDSLAKRAVVYSLERFASSFSDAELIQNPEDIKVLRRLRIPKRKITLLGNGIDLARFRPAPNREPLRRAIRTELGIPHDDIVIGAVGRLVWEKGYRELFEAMETVRRRMPRSRLLVVGPSDPEKADAVDAASISRAADAGVVFAGERTDVVDLYTAMDVYVLASHREGFPRSAMEAAAMGLPIVATDIRGCRQVVEDGSTGFLVLVDSPPELASALFRLVSDSTLRQKFGEAAIDKAAVEFDQRDVIETTLEAYDRLIGEQDHGRQRAAQPRRS